MASYLPSVSDVEYKFLILRADGRIEWEPGAVGKLAAAQRTAMQRTNLPFIDPEREREISLGAQADTLPRHSTFPRLRAEKTMRKTSGERGGSAFLSRGGGGGGGGGGAESAAVDLRKL